MRCWAAALALLPLAALAHPLAPALLELRHDAGAYEVLWRTPVAQVRGVSLAPQLPPDCAKLGEPVRAFDGNEAVEWRWRVRCADADLASRNVSVSGLAGSGINVVVRLERPDGQVFSAILDARHATAVIPAPEARGQRLAGFFSLGVRHLLTGLDHVLFVLGLLLGVRGWKPLVLTVTAFTMGHSLTLAAATLGLLQVNPALTELGIALSLVAVAVAALQRDASLLTRRPATLALGFGLLHGLGFAGALSAAGLPPGDIPLALLLFNLGIEAGQLAVVAAGGLLLALRAALPLAGRLPARQIAAYIIGSVAAMWFIERTAVLLA